MSKKTRKYREKQIEKAKKRVSKAAKRALKGKKGKDITSVVKSVLEERKELSEVFASEYKITDARERGEGKPSK